MTFARWEKHTTTFERYLPTGYHAMAELVAKAAFQARQRHGENVMKENWLRSEQRRKQGLPT